MFYVPYGHIQLLTNVDRESAVKVLADNIEPPKFLKTYRGNHKFFEGHIEQHRFKVNRVTHYKYTFAAVVIGEFHSHSDKTVLDIKIRFDFAAVGILLIIALLIFVFSFWLSFQFYVYSSFPNFIRFIVDTLITPFSIFYLVIIVLFNIESAKVIDFLNGVYGVSKRERVREKKNA